MSYRLKVCYRGHWKISRSVYSTFDDVMLAKSKLESMGVKSKLCDSTGKEIDENGSCTD